MTSLAQEMERKGHEARMQVSKGGFLTPSKPPNLLLGAGVGVGGRIAEVRFLDEKRDEERRQKRRKKMALETGLGWEGGRGPSWGCQGLRGGSDLGARSLREQRW